MRDGSPAAGLHSKDNGGEGDRIVEVEVKNADGSTTLFAADVAEAKARRKDESKLAINGLDPLRLPWLLLKWAQTALQDAKVKLTVLRTVDHSEKRITLELPWDRVSAADLGGAGGPGSSPLTPVRSTASAWPIRCRRASTRCCPIPPPRPPDFRPATPLKL